MTTVSQTWYDLPFPPTHYYSPLPDVKLVKRNSRRWFKEDDPPGLDWNPTGQKQLVDALLPFAPEAATLPPFHQVTLDGYGPGYGEVEAHVLYMMLRHLQPARVVEVGSGVSTFFTLQALAANRTAADVAATMTCVEPYPNEKLRALVASGSVDLRVAEVQDVDIRVFTELSGNDVLFIDSSHVSKRDSDVDFLFLEVLPRLQKDVIVHVHDIPFPLPAPPPDHPMFDTYLFWNEWAVVRAFLQFNSAFRIVMCQSYLHLRDPGELTRLVASYDPRQHFPSSLWLRKVM